VTLKVRPGPGLAIESATEHVEVLVVDAAGEAASQVREEVGHGHTRRLSALVAEALGRAKISPESLLWIASDLGPGSFTGVRVGLATAAGLALPSGAARLGASSLASLALSSGARRALLVPLVPAGHRDLYAGFFRADTRGQIRLLASPRVGDLEAVFRAVNEVMALVPGFAVKFLGPGAGRERARLEGAFEGSTFPAWRHDGLSAEDLARAATAGLGPAAGLPARSAPFEPLYVRPAQAEERVRRRALAGIPIRIREFTPADLSAVTALERRVFGDPWPESFFREELSQPLSYARIAERPSADAPSGPPRLAGYLVAWVGSEEGHLANLAVAPEQRRAGVARALVEDLLSSARQAGVKSLSLEVRVSNDAAQALYRSLGFRLAGLRRGYYRDSGEDALIMLWSARARDAMPLTP